MTEVDWISTVNLMAGGPARVGMTSQQRSAHLRLSLALPAVVYMRPRHGLLPQVVELRAPRMQAGRC